MIITFDTSILVRATKRSNGPARKVIELLAANPDHIIALSLFILSEIARVLSYPRLRALYGLTDNEIHDHLLFLQSICRIVEPQGGLPVVLSDPKDDPIVYTAVAAGADVLCVKDKHFYKDNVVSFCEQHDIRVMDDVALLELLQRTS